MQKLRQHIISNANTWLISLVLLLVFMLSMQLHIHREHTHPLKQVQHSQESAAHQAHFGNTHDTAHDSTIHPDHESYSVDISPTGLNKSFTLALLACALTSVLLLLLSPPSRSHLLIRQLQQITFSQRHSAIPPQLRAPPL